MCHTHSHTSPPHHTRSSHLLESQHWETEEREEKQSKQRGKGWHRLSVLRSCTQPLGLFPFSPQVCLGIHGASDCLLASYLSSNNNCFYALDLLRMKNTDDNCSEPVLVKKENYLPQQSLSAPEKKSSRSPLLAKRTATTSSSGLGSPSCTIFSAPPDDAEDKKPCIPSPSAQQEGNVGHRHDAFYSHHNHEIKSVMCNDEEDDNDAIGSDGSDRASDDGHELIQKGKQCTKKSFCHRSNYDDNENTIYDTEGSNNQQTGSGHEFMIDPAISALYHK